MLYKYIPLFGVALFLTTSLCAAPVGEDKGSDLFRWIRIRPSDSAVTRVKEFPGWGDLAPEKQSDILRSAEEIDKRYQANLETCDRNSERDANFDLKQCRNEQAYAQEKNIKAQENRVKVALGM